MPQKKHLRILCVDDEPHILDSLAMHLRKNFEVHLASSGAQALKMIQQFGPFAVVLSDMRMPEMDGATLLSQVKKLSPETVRMLLTGETSISLATKAINEGHIFLFLTKPCPPDQLLKSVNAAVKQHQLIIAERVLLQETLLGSLKALIDVLAITNPLAFSRATRIKKNASKLAKKVAVTNRWQVEAAAIVSQLGYISLPESIVKKVFYGKILSADEKVLVSEVPKVTKQLLEHIPRLDPIIEALETFNKPLWKNNIELTKTIPVTARILKIVLDFDSLEVQGQSVQLALDTLRAREHIYDKKLLEAFAECIHHSDKVNTLIEIPLRSVQVGAVLVDEVYTEDGRLLVPKNYEVTKTFLQRVRNFDSELLNKKVRVFVID